MKVLTLQKSRAIIRQAKRVQAAAKAVAKENDRLRRGVEQAKRELRDIGYRLNAVEEIQRRVR